MTHRISRGGALIALAVMSAMVLTSCSIGTKGGSTATNGTGANASSTIVIGSDNTADTLDPLQASNAKNDFNIAPIYDRLVTFDSKGTMVPQLATSWQYSDNARVLTLTLRKGVTFHSGNPFTAADVVYTLDRTKKIGSGADSFIPDYVSAKAVDPQHVQITIAKTDLDFIGALSMIYILDSKLVQQHEGSDNGQTWLAGHDAGSGPYAMTGYQANQQVTLTRFKGYWDYTAARPAKIILQMMNDASAKDDAFLAGNLDITMGLTTKAVEAIQKNPQDRVQNLPSLRQSYLWMNNQGGVTKNAQVREAIALGIDYKGYLSAALQGAGQIADAIMPPGMTCRVDFGQPTQDVAKAKKLIQDAHATGDTITMAYQPNVPEFSAGATLIQASLKQIGLNVKLQGVTFPQYAQMASKQATMPDLALAWDFGSFPAAGPMLNRDWNSTFAGQTNFTWYSNAKVDQLLNDGQVATDESQACQDYESVQKQVVADHAMAYLAVPAVTMVMNHKVQPIPFLPTSQDFNVGALRMAK